MRVPRGTISINPLHAPDDLRSALLHGLGEIALAASDEQVESLLQLALLLSRWSQRANLTGHREPTTIVRRLLLDAAALFGVLPEFSTVADLGSGAGFPGLPLAILRPASRVLLVESRERRHHFQLAAIRALRLPNAVPRRGRIEALEPEASSLVLAQAAGPPRRVLTWMLPWAEPGGLLVIPGGERAPDPGNHPLAVDPRVLHYRVPLGGPARTLWTARRASRADPPPRVTAKR